MCDDGAIDPYMPEYEESTMEIVIETLTGTTFEMTVSPVDTIVSIKTKIQRVEGILVAHQHLLFRMEELHNDARLCDHGVSAGATLRLVLSMRGGPISTRRLASTEHHLAWREIKEYVDTTREDILDKLPPGSKVTVLLFREGEHINLIRVIENEDGTCYPFSDSWVPVNKSKPKEMNQPKHGNERTVENNVLMRKVVELRRKMEGLSVQKKTRQPIKTDDITNENLPSTSSLNNEVSTSASSEFESLQASHRDSYARRIWKLHSDRLLFIQQQRSKTNMGRSHRPYRVDSSLSTSPKSEEIPLLGRNCSSSLQAPSIAILEEEPESALNKKEPEFSSPGPISVPSGDADTVAMSQIPSLPGSSRNLVHLAHMAHLVLENHTDRPKTSPEQCEPKARDICNLLLNDATEGCRNTGVKMGVTNRRQSIDYSRSLNYNNTNLPRMQYASSSTSRVNCIDKNYKREHNYSNSSEVGNDWSPSSYSPTMYHRSSNLLTSQYASTSKLNSAHLDNLLGNRVTESSNAKFNEGKRSPLYGRRARIERIRNNTVDSNADKYGYNNLGYMANIEKIQNDAVSVNKQVSPLYRRRNIGFVSNLESSSNNGSSSPEMQPFKLSKRSCEGQIAQVIARDVTEKIINEIRTLPSIVPKKSAKTRCALCNKRLNITTVHTCRCGGIFCAQHRYSEVHGCQYDYKTEGRKFLEQANPLVAAPKLPKI